MSRGPATRIVLVGPHGAGKTSLGRALATQLGLPFDEEIGRQLSELRQFRPAGRDAAESDPEFDAEVLRREQERDVARGDTPRIIETWHPGNFAYAARRSPAIASRYARLRDTVAGTAYVLPVVASWATLAARQNEPGPLAFFVDVGRDASLRAAALGLCRLAAVQTDHKTANDLASQLAPYLRRLLGHDAHESGETARRPSRAARFRRAV